MVLILKPKNFLANNKSQLAQKAQSNKVAQGMQAQNATTQNPSDQRTWGIRSAILGVLDEIRIATKRRYVGRTISYVGRN